MQQICRYLMRSLAIPWNHNTCVDISSEECIPLPKASTTVCIDVVNLLQENINK